MSSKAQAIGFLNIYKPSGVTSHDVVNQVRLSLGIKHVGHGGTLDPLAEGVLPLAVGSACRLLRFLPHNKRYLAEVLLGRRTTTDDIEGETLEEHKLPATSISREAVLAALRSFQGQIKQRPPVFSAIHHQGKRLYELARQGKVFAVEERDVHVHSIDLLTYEYPLASLRISSSSGVYIRSIARDLGEKLGCGGCLKSLIREKSGPFAVEDSLCLQQRGDRELLLRQIMSPVSVLAQNPDLAVLPVREREREALCRGQKLAFDGVNINMNNFTAASAILASYDGELVAVCKIDSEGKIKPEVVLSHAE